MITVNLRPDSSASAPAIPSRGCWTSVRGLGSQDQGPAPAGRRGELGLRARVGSGFVYLGTVRQLYALEPRLEQARAENRRFKAFLADKRHQEKIRDSLLAQITVIRSVDGDRYIWPHLLDEVTKALPAYTWLVDLGAGRCPRPARPPPRRPSPPAQRPTRAAGRPAAGAGRSR